MVAHESILASSLSDMPSRQDSAHEPYPIAAMTCDSWQLDKHHSGVVSYTTNLVQGMRQLNAAVHILASKIPSKCEVNKNCKDYNYKNIWPVPTWSQIRGMGWKRIIAGISRRIRPDETQSWMMAQRLLFALHKLYIQYGIQILETEESCGVARMLMSRSPVPIIVRLHGPWFLVGPAAGADRQPGFAQRVNREGQCILSATAVSAPSHEVIRRTEAFYGENLPFSTVIPNPVCLPRESQRWNYDHCDPESLLFVGRFDRIKGADILLRAFAHVLQLRPSAQLIVVGEDTGIVDEQGRRYLATEYINRVLPDRVLASRVELLGVRTQAEIVELRQRAFAAVVTSRYESFSMVTLEAMASGMPVIAPRVGGVPEIVEHENNGLLFQAEDPSDLAVTILQLMNHPDLARRLGQKAARDAALNYSPLSIAQRTLAFYQEVIARS